MLSLKNVSKSIRNKRIVKDISFEVLLGQICGLLGPNGAGKTTTFYLIAGLIKSDSGEILLADEDVSNIPMHKRSKKGIKYLPQEPSIFQNLTVYENLLGLAELSFSNTKDLDLFLEQSIDEFKLSKILSLKGRQLSGGQRRKVEIARTLASNPKIILLDEPFAGIDPIAIEEIKQVLVKLKNKNIGILITDHNVRESLEICDQAIVINDGKVIAEGNKELLINNEIVKKVYLGNMYS
jgi:lipopolysaccharide export system ATP-binding protein